MQTTTTNRPETQQLQLAQGVLHPKLASDVADCPPGRTEVKLEVQVAILNMSETVLSQKAHKTLIADLVDCILSGKDGT